MKYHISVLLSLLGCCQLANAEVSVRDDRDQRISLA